MPSSSPPLPSPASTLNAEQKLQFFAFLFDQDLLLKEEEEEARELKTLHLSPHNKLNLIFVEMGLSYHCASSILLCSEDNSSILSFDDEEEEVERHWSDCRLQPKSCELYRDFLMGFPLLSDECVLLLLQRELEHQPKEDYAKRLINGSLDVSIRSDAIDWMLKVGFFGFIFVPINRLLILFFLDLALLALRSSPFHGILDQCCRSYINCLSGLADFVASFICSCRWLAF